MESTPPTSSPSTELAAGSIDPAAGSNGARATIWIALALPAAWVALHAPAVRWLWRSLPTAEYATSLVLLLAAAAFLGGRAFRAWREGRVALSTVPRMNGAALALVLACAVGYVALGAAWNVNVVSASLAGLGAYGLVGLYVAPSAWRAALPGALLLVGALPFGEHATFYLGFPARVATAQFVQHGLAAMGIPSLSAQTLLVLENGAANVDAPCSGIRSAWTGLVFFLAATCVERARPGARWALAGAGYVGLLFIANAVRVASIALLSYVAQRPQLAHVAHEPLGVAGFALASGAAFLALRHGVPKQPLGAPSPMAAPARWLAPALAACLAALALARAPFSPPRPPRPAPLAFPAELSTSPLALSPAEEELYAHHGGAVAAKARFTWRGLEGSLLVVHSNSWRAHHPPEQCLRANGLSLDHDLPVEIPGGPLVRWLRTEDGAASAFYWFQSPATTTNDLTSRVLADVRGQERRWALVTVVLDHPPAGLEPVQPLLVSIRDAVAASFQGGTP